MNKLCTFCAAINGVALGVEIVSKHASIPWIIFHLVAIIAMILFAEDR